MTLRPSRRGSDLVIWAGLVVMLAITVLPGLMMIGEFLSGNRGGVLLGGFGLLIIVFGLVMNFGLYRQYFLGRPRAVIEDDGLTIGRRTIPWAEVIEVQARQLLGVPYVGLFVGKPASRRFPIVERLDWVASRDGNAMIELLEAQLGLSVDAAVARCAEARRGSAAREIG